MRKILVALDGSKRQADVLRAASSLARKTGARLVLFRAVGLPDGLPPEAYSIPPNEVPILLEQRAQSELEKIEQQVPDELRGGVVVHIGSPWQAIDRAAKDHDADAIVIGSHGFSGLDHVIGTTAAKVVNHADRTVIVVRDADRFTREVP
ncbi:MAG: universal stress protein [Polyangiaceae bacterium]